MSNDLLTKTPRWDHIANSKSYNSALARKLLEHPSRGKLADSVAALGGHLDQVQKFHVGIESSSTDRAAEPEFVAACMAAEGALETAKVCIAVIAACNVVEDFASNPKGSQMAQSLLSKSVGLPDALKKRLKTIATA